MDMTPTMFPDLVLSCPDTEGFKYTGSKLKLIPYILQLTDKGKSSHSIRWVFWYDSCVSA
ncbi:unnamed protein product, partial [marine sediment metagenome]